MRARHLSRCCGAKQHAGTHGRMAVQTSGNKSFLLLFFKKEDCSLFFFEKKNQKTLVPFA
jgi:hypothetical protein